jgi:hypothetical protein
MMDDGHTKTQQGLADVQQKEEIGKSDSLAIV